MSKCSLASSKTINRSKTFIVVLPGDNRYESILFLNLRQFLLLLAR